MLFFVESLLAAVIFDTFVVCIYIYLSKITVVLFTYSYSYRFDWIVLVPLDSAWLEPILPIEAYSEENVWLSDTGMYRIVDVLYMCVPSLLVWLCYCRCEVTLLLSF